MLDLGTLYNLETQMAKPLKVTSKVKSMCSMKHALFSPDEQHVVLTCEDGSQYAFSVPTGKWCGTFRESDNFLFGSSDERDSIDGAAHILPNGHLLSRGLSYQTKSKLYLRDVADGLRTIKEFSGHCYGIRFVILNNSKTLAASATADTSIINGVNTKYVYIWDLEKLEQHSVCKGKGPYSMISFAGGYEEYVLSSGWRDSNITVWFIGSRSNPCAEGVPVYNIIGHTQDIVYMRVCKVSFAT